MTPRPSPERLKLGQVCSHGQLERQCLTGELQGEIERLEGDARIGIEVIHDATAKTEVLRGLLRECVPFVRYHATNLTAIELVERINEVDDE